MENLGAQSVREETKQTAHGALQHVKRNNTHRKRLERLIGLNEPKFSLIKGEP